jgi:hypothetical protein
MARLLSDDLRAALQYLLSPMSVAVRSTVDRARLLDIELRVLYPSGTILLSSPPAVAFVAPAKASP